MKSYVVWVLDCLAGSVIGAALSWGHEGYTNPDWPQFAVRVRDHLTYILDALALAIAQGLALKVKLPKLPAAGYVVLAMVPFYLFVTVMPAFFPDATGVYEPGSPAPPSTDMHATSTLLTGLVALPAAMALITAAMTSLVIGRVAKGRLGWLVANMLAAPAGLVAALGFAMLADQSLGTTLLVPANGVAASVPLELTVAGVYGLVYGLVSGFGVNGLAAREESHERGAAGSLSGV